MVFWGTPVAPLSEDQSQQLTFPGSKFTYPAECPGQGVDTGARCLPSHFTGGDDKAQQICPTHHIF